VPLGDQDFLDVLQSVDDDARHGTHLELDHLAVVDLDEVGECLVGHVVASQNVERAENRPGLGARWIRQGGQFVIVQFLRCLPRPDVVDEDQDQGYQSDGEQEVRRGADRNHPSGTITNIFTTENLSILLPSLSLPPSLSLSLSLSLSSFLRQNVSFECSRVLECGFGR